MMIAGLQLNGVEVIECHEKLWQGIEDRVSATSGGWLRPTFWARFLKTYLNLMVSDKGIKSNCNTAAKGEDIAGIFKRSPQVVLMTN